MAKEDKKGAMKDNPECNVPAIKKPIAEMPRGGAGLPGGPSGDRRCRSPPTPILREILTSMDVVEPRTAP
jgi:hypothetical protein